MFTLLAHIIAGTPYWVWGLLAALLVLGANQLFTRQLRLRRVVMLPLAMLGLSAFGITSAFGASGELGTVLLVWLSAGAVTGALVLQQAVPQGTRFDGATQTFSVPGSVVPLLLILAIFMTKYTVGVALAMHLEFVRSAGFPLTVGLLYGAFSGVFAARALRLVRLALRDQQGTALQGAAA